MIKPLGVLLGAGIAIASAQAIPDRPLKDRIQ